MGANMIRNIKIGIIGSGKIAAQHAQSYMNILGVEVVGVADVIPKKAQRFIDELGISSAKSFENHHDLLELDLDGVSICTPNFVHHKTSVDALRAGKHVLVEKPLAVKLTQGIEMVQVAKEMKKILSVGYQPRYDPNMKKVKNIIKSGELGEIYYVEIGGGRRRGMPTGTFINKKLAGVGAVGDIGTYSLDLALNALGHPKPLTVSAYTSNHFGTNSIYHPEADKFEVEDFGVAMIRLEGGIILNVKISWAMHMDTLGTAIFLGKDAGLKLAPTGTGPWSGVWDGGIGSINMYYDESNEHVDLSIPVKKHDIDIFSAKIKDFVCSIREEKPAPIPAEEIIINLAIIEGIIKSSTLNKEVEIHLPIF